jgi:EH domain-containing protein 1
VGIEDKESPFGYKKGEGMDEGAGDHDWVVAKLRFNTDVKFDALDPVDGKITGAGKKILKAMQ